MVDTAPSPTIRPPAGVIPTAAAEPMLLTALQVAGLLGISRTTFFGLLSAGCIGPRAVRFGRRLVRWRRAEIEKWVLAGCPPAARWRGEEGGGR